MDEVRHDQGNSELLSIASHELRGPMTVIKGYLTMLESGAFGEIGEKARSVLPLLITKSDEVNWLIDQMIETARLEEDRLELKKRESDLLELTESAIAGMRLLMADREVRLDEPSDPVHADVDPERVQLVIRNLLSNAANYSSSGTKIAVRVHRDQDFGFVSVADQGPGIAPEDQDRLFTRRVRASGVRQVNGMGVGLWLSREIARRHGGDLTLRSGPDVGTTFALAVPLKS